jgi:hypothetical protein
MGPRSGTSSGRRTPADPSSAGLTFAAGPLASPQVTAKCEYLTQSYVSKFWPHVVRRVRPTVRRAVHDQAAGFVPFSASS